MAKIGAFVRAKNNDWGVGKLLSSDLALGTAEVEYFPSAGSSERPRETFRFTELGAVKLSAETRVYFFDVETGTWRSGRLRWQAGEDCFVDLPNRRQERVALSDLFVRWWRPLSDPCDNLVAHVTEAPFFHTSRTRLVAHLVRQRAFADDIVLELGLLQSSAKR